MTTLTEKFTDKTVLVVGGAAGLGAAVVTRMDELGIRTIVADTRRDAADSLFEDLDGEHRFKRMDMSDEASVKSVFAALKDEGLVLGGVVLTAGIYPNMALLGESAKDHHRLDTMIRILHVNLIGAFLVAREAASLLAATDADARGQRGSIIFSSGLSASPGHLALAASEGGVKGMTPVLAEELAVHGIRVNTIATAMVQTRMLRQAAEQLEHQQQRAMFPELPGRAADFALMVEQVLLNPLINGQVLELTAGLR